MECFDLPSPGHIFDTCTICMRYSILNVVFSGAEYFCYNIDGIVFSFLCLPLLRPDLLANRARRVFIYNKCPSKVAYTETPRRLTNE